jgi:hypothetical protein
LIEYTPELINDKFKDEKIDGYNNSIKNRIKKLQEIRDKIQKNDGIIKPEEDFKPLDNIIGSFRDFAKKTEGTGIYGEEVGIIQYINMKVTRLKGLIKGMSGRFVAGSFIDGPDLGEEDEMKYDNLVKKYAKSLSERTEWKDLIPGGKADGNAPADYPKDQIEMGMKVEKEHTKDPKTAVEIAMDHLEEFDDYYDRLEEMEAEAEKEKGEKEDFKFKRAFLYRNW